MSSETDKFRKLVEMLWEKTDARELPWAFDSKIKSVSIAIGNRVLSITASQNDNYEDLYVVDIYNDRGQLIDRFNDENINSEKPSFSQFTTYFSMLESIYSFAQRKAVGADVALDEMLVDLEKGNVSGDLDDDLPF